MEPDNFLSRAEIDLILATITSRDLFAALGGQTGEVQGGEVAGKVFEAAAERQGYGPGCLDRVRVNDGIYLAAALGELFSDGPKEGSTEDLPVSPATGD